jgi:two-component system chemotaxis response regulator CheY
VHCREGDCSNSNDRDDAFFTNITHPRGRALVEAILQEDEMISRTSRYALAVDDDPSFLRTLQLMLRLSGFPNVIAEAEGSAALERLAAWRFDLIVSDWNMDPMDGVELLRRVRGNPATTHTPFILITASLSESAWRNAIEFGATDFLLKPLSLNSLRSACDIGTRMHAFESGAVISLADRLRQRRFNV